MRLGCCCSEDRLPFAETAGFDYLEPGVPLLRTDLSDADFEPLRLRLQNMPVRPEAFNIFVPGDLKITGDSVNTRALMRHVETAMRRAADLGGRIIVFGSGGARNVPDGFSRAHAFEQLGFFCAMAADLAARYDLTVVVEPLTAARCNLITSVAEGAELVQQVGHSHFALLADLYHMEVDSEPWANLIENAPMLKHIHVPVPSLDMLTTQGRDFSHTLFLKTLKNTGYDGRISIEDNDKRFSDFAGEAPQAAARVRDLWDSV